MKRQKLYISIAVMCAVLLLGGAGGSAAWKQTAAGRKYTTSSGKYVKSRWKKIIICNNIICPLQEYICILHIFSNP